MRIHVEAWEPSFDPGSHVDLADAAAPVRLDVEVPAGRFAPRRGGGAGGRAVVFVDGVRRVEARVVIEGDDGVPVPGVCASHAAGMVRCDGRARVAGIEVGRGLFTPSPHARDLPTRAGAFPVRGAAGDSPEALWLAVQDSMARAEARLASAARERDPAALLVVDGPLRGPHPAGAVAYIKSHRVAYLPPAQAAILGEMAPGERTPLFAIGASYPRLSWYLRLPGGGTAPWAGIVRCETAASLPVAAAVALADEVAGAIPRFASTAPKDPRAPQNLFPIGGLERELRRRLGDPHLLWRALREAAAS